MVGEWDGRGAALASTAARLFFVVRSPPGRSTASTKQQTSSRQQADQHSTGEGASEFDHAATHANALELVGEVGLAGGRGVEAVAHTNERSTREYTLIHGRGVHAVF